MSLAVDAKSRFAYTVAADHFLCKYRIADLVRFFAARSRIVSRHSSYAPFAESGRGRATEGPRRANRFAGQVGRGGPRRRETSRYGRLGRPVSLEASLLVREV